MEGSRWTRTQSQSERGVQKSRSQSAWTTTLQVGSNKGATANAPQDDYNNTCTCDSLIHTTTLHAAVSSLQGQVWVLRRCCETVCKHVKACEARDSTDAETGSTVYRVRLNHRSHHDKEDHSRDREKKGRTTRPRTRLEKWRVR